jgi:hypothetical protein
VVTLVGTKELFRLAMEEEEGNGEDELFTQQDRHAERQHRRQT